MPGVCAAALDTAASTIPVATAALRKIKTVYFTGPLSGNDRAALTGPYALVTIMVTCKIRPMSHR